MSFIDCNGFVLWHSGIFFLKKDCGMCKEPIKRKSNPVYYIYSLKSLVFPMLLSLLTLKWPGGLYVVGFEEDTLAAARQSVISGELQRSTCLSLLSFSMPPRRFLGKC